MIRNVVILGLLSTLMVGGACGSSCVNFDGQTVRMHIDESKDRIDALFLYRGLHSSAADTSQALEQLEEVRDGARWFAFLSNWPFMIHVDNIVEHERDPTYPASNLGLDLVDESVEVRNGELWVDGEGRLNAYQLVRLRNLSAVVAAANAAMLEALRRPEGLEEFVSERLDDPETVALLRAAIDRGDAFIGIDGQAVTYTLPASDEGWTAVKRWLLDGLRGALDEHGDDSNAVEDAARRSNAMVEFLAVNEWSIEREPDRIVFVIGARHADELRLVTPTVGLEGTGLAGALRDRGWAIDPHADDSGAHRAYEAFRSEN